MDTSKEVRSALVGRGHFLTGSLTDLTAVSIPEDELKYLTVQHELADAWRTLAPEFPSNNVHVLPSIEHAIRLVRGAEKGKLVDVLVTGSLHLVGGVIEVANLSEVAL